MEELVDPQPGFFQLPLDVNSEPFDYDDVANFEFPILLGHLGEKLHRPERNAIRNLIGYVAASLEWYSESLTFLKKVLDEDRNNLNALANLKWVYNKMDGKTTVKESEIEKRLKELESTLSNPDRRSKIIARCIAEQGFALSYGINREYEAQYERASLMYERALEMAGDLVSNEERVDWKFGAARAGQKLLNKRVNRREFTTDVEFETQLIRNIQTVLLQGDTNMKAECWVQLGCISHAYYKRARLDNSRVNPPECIQTNKELLQCFSSPTAPIACYDKALEFRPNHPPILAVKAQRLKNMIVYDGLQQGIGIAFELLNQSITTDNSVFNQYAFSVRGEAFMDMYRKDRTMTRLVTEDSLLNLLNRAKADCEMSTRLHVNPADLRQLGDIWLYFSEDCTAETLTRVVRKTKLQCLETALKFYTLATEIGSQNPFNHWKRGECLSKLDDFHEAAECYKRSIECENSTPNKCMLSNYTCLLHAYLEMLKGTERHANESLVVEAAKSLNEALSTFGEDAIVKSCLRYLCKNYPAEICIRFNFFADICRDVGEIALADFIEKNTSRLHLEQFF